MTVAEVYAEMLKSRQVNISEGIALVFAFVDCMGKVGMLFDRSDIEGDNVKDFLIEQANGLYEANAMISDIWAFIGTEEYYIQSPELVEANRIRFAEPEEPQDNWNPEDGENDTFCMPALNQ